MKKAKNLSFNAQVIENDFANGIENPDESKGERWEERTNISRFRSQNETNEKKVEVVRSKGFQFQLSLDEYSLLASKALKAGCTVSELLEREIRSLL